MKMNVNKSALAIRQTTL